MLGLPIRRGDALLLARYLTPAAARKVLEARLSDRLSFIPSHLIGAVTVARVVLKTVTMEAVREGTRLDSRLFVRRPTVFLKAFAARAAAMRSANRATSALLGEVAAKHSPPSQQRSIWDESLKAGTSRILTLTRVVALYRLRNAQLHRLSLPRDQYDRAINEVAALCDSFVEMKERQWQQRG